MADRLLTDTLVQPGAVAKALYGMAVVLMPVSVASKFLLGVEGITWVNPTLLFAIGAGLALLSAWGDFLKPPLRDASFAGALLSTTSLVCALSGLVLRPTDDLYAVMREPLRFSFILVWTLVSMWFFLHSPRLVLRCVVASVMFALASGVYLHLMVFGLAPGPRAAAGYMRLYALRQSVWFHGFPIPRMGGLFIEAPPFGLFMLSMVVVFVAARYAGFTRAWTVVPTMLAVIGLMLSLAYQVLLGGLVSLALMLPYAGRRRPVMAWPAGFIVLCAMCLVTLNRVHESAVHDGAPSVQNINGNSIGERTFHFQYGLAVLEQRPWAAVFGIGPGRYGDYAADTGLYPASVTMQSSEPELLVEWGVVGLGCWLLVVGALVRRVWEQHRLVGAAWLLGLCVADSFQANWKAEATAFAVAALYALRSPDVEPATLVAEVSPQQSGPGEKARMA